MSGRALLESRRVRPIYDALDSGAYRSAAATAQKLLKSQPDYPLVQALLCVALIRSGRASEARPVALKVAAKRPAEASVLGALQMALVDLRLFDEIAKLYKDLWDRSKGTNEEFGAHAVMGFARVKDWKALQAVALKMHKAHNEGNYLWWGIAGLYLQAINSPEAQRSLLLTLPSRLISSQPSQTLHPERLHLHLRILLAQVPPDAPADHASLTEARQVLGKEGVAEVVKTSLALQEIRREVLERAKRWDELREDAVKELEAGSVNYANHLSLISALQHLSSEEATSSARSLFEARVAAVPLERGHLLAQLELERVLPSSPSDPTRLHELINAYFKAFGTKPVCYEDLRPYLAHLLDAQQPVAPILEHFRAVFAGESPTLQTIINAHKLLRFAEGVRTAEEESEKAEVFMKLHAEGLPHGKNLPETELQPADDLAVLAGLALISAWSTSHDVKYLHRALVHLESALAQSTPSYRLKILLIRIYRLLAAPSPVFAHSGSLRIQNIQQDTLSHFALSRASIFSTAADGDHSIFLAFPSLGNGGIWGMGEKENAEMIVKAYHKEAYSQLEDFISFADRIANSLQRHLVRIESLRMRAVKEKLSGDEALEALLELRKLDLSDGAVSDNRDYSLIPEWQAHGVSVDAQTDMGTKQAGHWLRAFALIYKGVLGASLGSTQVADNETAVEAFKTELTPQEAALFDFAHVLVQFNAATDDEARKSTVQAAAVFFKELEREYENATSEKSVALPWEALHIAQTAFEANALLELAVPAPSANKKKKGKAPSAPLFDVARSTLLKISEPPATALAVEGKFKADCGDLNAELVQTVGKGLQDARRKIWEGVKEGASRRFGTGGGA